MAIKVNRRLIHEFLYLLLNDEDFERTYGGFNVNNILDSIKDEEIIEDIVHQDFNPGFLVYNEKYRNNPKLAINVKTYIGYKEPFEAIPDFLTNIINNDEQLSENIYEDEFKNWQNNEFNQKGNTNKLGLPKKDISVEFGVAGRSGGYWTLSGFNAAEIFQENDQQSIQKGLTKHLLKELDGLEFDTKEDIFDEFNNTIDNLCQVSAYERDGYLNYVKNDLNLIKYDSDFETSLINSYINAKNIVSYYEYKPNIIRMILSDKEDLEAPAELFRKYDDYCCKKEIELLGITLDKKTDFTFKSDGHIIKFEIDTNYQNYIDIFARIKITVDEKDFDAQTHKNLKINGKPLEYYNINPVGFLDYRKLEIKNVFSKIKELLNFEQLYNKSKTFNKQEILFTIKNKEPIEKDIIFDTKLKLNKDNKFIFTSNIFIEDRNFDSKVTNAILKMPIQKNKIIVKDIVEELDKTHTLYNFEKNNLNQLKKAITKFASTIDYKKEISQINDMNINNSKLIILKHDLKNNPVEGIEVKADVQKFKTNLKRSEITRDA